MYLAASRAATRTLSYTLPNTRKQQLARMVTHSKGDTTAEFHSYVNMSPEQIEEVRAMQPSAQAVDAAHELAWGAMMTWQRYVSNLWLSAHHLHAVVGNTREQVMWHD
jgi:hypothetical protein